MPEKPEVITVANSLKKELIGHKITDCNVYWENIIAYPTADTFKRKIINQKIENIATRGKWLVFTLDKDLLLIHLRMEGKFFFRKKGTTKMKHEHVEFILDDDISFRFHDVRKFGKMVLLDKENAYDKKPLCDLGYEYNDGALTKEYLYQKIHTKNTPIKTVLLDQSIIAGIGNIYDDEILFLSHISPERKASSLTLENCQDIIENTIIVLDKAIEKGGTTIKSFTSSEGVHGLFQNELLVHGKVKTPCSLCGTEIIKTRIGGRGTYYCPHCQK